MVLIFGSKDKATIAWTKEKCDEDGYITDEKGHRVTVTNSQIRNRVDSICGWFDEGATSENCLCAVSSKEHMSTSFVEYQGRGFWSWDGYLEPVLALLANQIGDSPN